MLPLIFYINHVNRRANNTLLVKVGCFNVTNNIMLSEMKFSKKSLKRSIPKNVQTQVCNVVIIERNKIDKIERSEKSNFKTIY